MSIYNTGSVRVRVGSSLVKGTTDNEDFSTNAQAGYLFKLTGESILYQIATVTNATNLTLSSRYANSTYQTLRSAEHSATMTTATKMYSGTLNYYPVIQNAITITASGESFTDDSGGVLTGNASPAGSGTINYDTGAWTVTLGTDLTATAEMTASYYSGDTRTGMAYQIVTDYTPIYSFPEMSLTDVNFPHIYTKALRLIDSQISQTASLIVASVIDLDASVSAINANLTASVNNLQASMNLADINITNLQASMNDIYVTKSFIYRTIIDHGTATSVTIATTNLSKIHKFSNTATANITFPTITSSQKGYWIMLRKKGVGDVDFKCQGANTVDDNATHIKCVNASQTSALLKLSIETATNFELENMIGDWSTY